MLWMAPPPARRKKAVWLSRLLERLCPDLLLNRRLRATLSALSMRQATALVAPRQSLAHKLPGHWVSSSLRQRQRLQEF
jgi:hypothetical protein